MLDWLGSLQIRERSSTRVELGLSRATRVAGWCLLALGAWATLLVWSSAGWLALLPGIIAALGITLVTLRRRFVFDRRDGVLRVEQKILGIATRAAVPLFHLRAVVVVVRNGVGGVMSSRHIAYIDRRVGEPIYLDHARRCARLLEIAEAIAEVAELRLEYDAMSRASGEH